MCAVRTFVPMVTVMPSPRAYRRLKRATEGRSRWTPASTTGTHRSTQLICITERSFTDKSWAPERNAARPGARGRRCSRRRPWRSGRSWHWRGFVTSRRRGPSIRA